MFVYFIILILIIFLANYIEPFQSFRHDNQYIPYSFVPIKQKNIMLTVPVIDSDQCTKLCTDTPRCVGFNYNQNSCTLYKGKQDDFMVYGAYRRYW